MDETKTPESTTEAIYTPKPGETQLTVRAVVTGCGIGAIAGAMNIYLGLQIGWTVGGSLMAAILGFAIFQVINPERAYGVLETNITQTTGSAAGTMASAGGFVAPIPAMAMMGHKIETWALFPWALSVAFIGVCFAVPLRRQFVDVEKLKFPTGTAVAKTITSMYATAGEAVAQARALIYVGLIAGVFFLAAYFIPELNAPPMKWIGLSAIAAWSFSLLISPMMLGAGFLIGTRVTASLFAGAILSWGILAPIAESKGWVSNPNQMSMTGARGWILWPGVAIMVADALTSLALSWKTFVRTFKGAGALGAQDKSKDAIPNRWWMWGLAAASTGAVTVSWIVFDIPPYMSIMAIAMSAILAAVAVRSTGETDINPVGGMGKVTQLAFGGLSSAPATNLMTAAIAGAGASQAGDMMQDLKTGKLLGASPRKQFIAQVCGVAAGVFIVVPIYILFDSAYKIPGPKMEAPAAQAWAGVARIMTQGFSALPQYTGWAVAAGLAFGIAMPLIRKAKPNWAPYMPSGLAFGIAFIVPAKYSITMFIGAMILLGWKKKNNVNAERFAFAVACGLIAGEGLIGVVHAIFMLLKVPTLT